MRLLAREVLMEAWPACTSRCTAVYAHPTLQIKLRAELIGRIDDMG